MNKRITKITILAIIVLTIVKYNVHASFSVQSITTEISDGGFTLSNILLIGLISVSTLLVFLAIAILIRLNRLNTKLKKMGIQYDVTGFSTKEEIEEKKTKKSKKDEENPFKGLYNNYQDTQEKSGNYVANDYNNYNQKHDYNEYNITNNSSTNTNNFSEYNLDGYNMMEEEDTKVNLDVFTRITNENPYTSASTSVNEKIIIRPKGSK